MKGGGMDLNVAIVDLEITVLDYESTGVFAGYPNEPWQIGLVSLKAGKVAMDSMFGSLLRVDANRPFNPHAPGRHALLRNEIAEAPTPQDLWSQIKPRLLGLPLCAHNVATEKKFLRAMAPMHTFGPWLDTLRIARSVWPGMASYSLGDLVDGLNLKPRVDALCPGHAVHDALYDAVASALLLEHLLNQPGWNLCTLEELLSLSHKPTRRS